MRFMMIVRATPKTETGEFTSADKADFDAMDRYNDELIKAGVLLAAEGLKPSSSGHRVKFSGGRATVTDGPFSETKELIAGFWLLQVKDRAEALDWARRVPFDNGDEVELREIYEVHDLPEDVVSRESADKEQAWRDTTLKPMTC